MHRSGPKCMKILVCGSANMDDTYQVPHFVREGETLSSEGYTRNAGGKGLNQAIALSRAGAEVCFAGGIGRDGMFLMEELKQNRVDTSRLLIRDEATGHAIIQVTPDGENAILLFGGANRSFRAEDIPRLLEGMEEGDWLLVQNEISCLEEIVGEAKRRGMQIVLNPSPMEEKLRSLLPLVDWLMLNEVEGADLTGTREPEEILDRLVEQYPGMQVVLTLGENGSIYARAAVRKTQPAVPVSAVDTTAAGDTYTGYFLSGILRGLSVGSAMALASSASAIAVTHPGAVASIPQLQTVLEAMIP